VRIALVAVGGTGRERGVVEDEFGAAVGASHEENGDETGVGGEGGRLGAHRWSFTWWMEQLREASVAGCCES
jgi:hypothetical protein